MDRVDADLMRVGSRVRAEIITGSIDDGVVLPAHAIYSDASNAYVYIVSGSRVERRDVTVGQRSPDRVEVIDGITAGDRISLVMPADAS